VTFTEEDRLRGKIDYNYAERDYFSAEAPGISVFFKDKGGAIFHSYSCYARGLDIIKGTYGMRHLLITHKPGSAITTIMRANPFLI
jgi:predicted dithiol-disulfide oxidoreductase (DUF899 family)